MKCLSVSLGTSLPGFILLDKQLKQTNKQKPPRYCSFKKKQAQKNLILE